MVIATANGLLTLSIPVEGGRNQRALYRDIRVDNSADWQTRHWRSIFSAYGKSPWFFQYADSLEDVYRHRDPFLVDWNFRCLEWVCSALRLPADSPLQLACRNRDGHAATLPAVIDETPSPAPGFSAGASRPGTPSVVQPVLDLRDRIRPNRFQDPDMGPFPRYPQVFEERWGFQPNLGIVDLLFCCGPGAMALLRGTSGRAGY